MGQAMKAIVYREYGTPDVLEFQEVDPPVVADDEILLQVRAASVNPYDWHYVTGAPYLVRLSAGLRRPKQPIPGADMAGEVAAVGRNVTQFAPGDEVFGLGGGSFAEYVSVRADRMARKPAGLTFEQAAAVPMAGLTALQGLRDRGRLRSGQQVLVIGASGGVGTFAVQLAKSFGAAVTGVCSSRNVAAVGALGADHVVDYTREDFVRGGRRYDLILDIAGNRSIADRRRALTPKGTLVLVGGPKENRWVGPLGSLVRMLVVSRVGRQRMVGMLTKNSVADLVFLGELLAAGTVTPVIERTYPLPEAPEALRYVGAGHAQGKIVITV
jgi:NADPH:quinone reductase-like Zn-dependent oxidoreductase